MSEVVEKEEKDDWMQKKWRPMMAVMYMACCAFDFIVAPIGFTAVQFWETEAVNDAFRQWQPITLGGGGFFHIAMGAVLGISAYGRTQEKMAGAASNTSALPASLPAPTMNATAPMPAPTPATTVPPVAKPASMDFGIK